MNLWPFDSSGPVLQAADLWNCDVEAIGRDLAGGASVDRKITLNRPLASRAFGRGAMAKAMTPEETLFCRCDRDIPGAMDVELLDRRNQVWALLLNHGLKVQHSDQARESVLCMTQRQLSNSYFTSEDASPFTVPMANYIRLLDEAGATWEGEVSFGHRSIPFLQMIEEVYGHGLAQELRGGYAYMSTHKMVENVSGLVEQVLENRQARLVKALPPAATPVNRAYSEHPMPVQQPAVPMRSRRLIW